ncbi:hypothetical protein [Cytobacillus kochii]|uniref:hypothetical protein n=1 Tax=Cytobacillus kochii TaxID=859143 RepID=UPI00402AB2C3
MIFIKIIAWVAYWVTEILVAIAKAPACFLALVHKELATIYKRKQQKQLENAGSKGEKYD